MNRNPSLDSWSTESDIFHVECSSEESSPMRNNTPAVLNSTELSGAMARETITNSSVASPEPQTVTIDSDSNEPTFPYGFRNQHPIMPPSLNDLNLPHNPFNVLATTAVFRPDEEYSPQSPEPSDPSPISKPPINLSTIEGIETPHTTTDDTTFYSDGEPRRVHWDTSLDETFDSNQPRQVFFASSPSSTPPPPPRQKRKLSMGMSFLQKGECRSTPMRHAASPYQPKRHPNAQGETQTLILIIRLLTNYSLLFLIIVHKYGYVCSTYPKQMNGNIVVFICYGTLYSTNPD